MRKLWSWDCCPVWGIDELEKFYSEGDYWGDSKTEMLLPKKYPVPYGLAVSRWGLIEPLFGESGKQISILDIGAGHGFLGMVAAKSKKVHLSNYVCVEKDKTLGESLKKTWSVYFSKSNLQIKDQTDQVEGKYNCIILSHILEHLYEPKKMLQIVLKKLAKRGVLFIDVPNQDYLFKEDVFPHLLFFNISSLQYLLKDCGLKINSIKCYGNDMNCSPMNFRNASKFRNLLVDIMMRTKVIIPESIILAFFNKYFEMDKRNINGIWIRAIGQFAV